jgi:hypothetical protein
MLCSGCTAGTPCLRASLVAGIGSCVNRQRDWDAGKADERAAIVRFLAIEYDQWLRTLDGPMRVSGALIQDIRMGEHEYDDNDALRNAAEGGE